MIQAEYSGPCTGVNVTSKVISTPFSTNTHVFNLVEEFSTYNVTVTARIPSLPNVSSSSDIVQTLSACKFKDPLKYATNSFATMNLLN